MSKSGSAPLGQRLARLRAVDQHTAAVEAVRRVRGRLPGDAAFGDPLSSAGRDGAGTLARISAQLFDDKPRASRELGLAALQLWQAGLERTDRDRDVTLMFTDLVGFSEWALQVGDDDALVLLRRVASALEPSMAVHRGRIVKRLGDGLMVAFPAPQQAWDALCEAQRRLAGVQLDGYGPAMRAGLHTGRPRGIGDDYLGVDVTVAARLVEKASPGEVLVSETTLSGLDRDRLSVRRKKTFALRQVKGVPADLDVFAVTAR